MFKRKTSVRILQTRQTHRCGTAPPTPITCVGLFTRENFQVAIEIRYLGYNSSYSKMQESPFSSPSEHVQDRLAFVFFSVLLVCEKTVTLETTKAD